ncbi:hypothetical protein [Calycomorphotria hydatis]|uniref:Uncharacterized protein n=1 Tax=Calycomorphotria hydatis TaxID=2528027 RepID=A0A517T7F0_9PLAN|nr:hypothetical protein [Calycomorphotria hydatis]QDT64301.1 hypothetical protein V22_15330 [Calycomorphotria hydatis]
MSLPFTKKPEPTLAKGIAAEDIAVGDVVATFTHIDEFPSYHFDCNNDRFEPDRYVRLRGLPYNAGEPRKVIAVCLPFVYTQTLEGWIDTIDTRQSELVKLDAQVADAVWTAHKAAQN